MPRDSGTVQHGIVLPNWTVDGEADRLVEYAVAAEGAGWDGVFLADHLTFPPRPEPEDLPEEYVDEGSSDERTADERTDRPFPDPWITLAGIASRTESVRLGSWITPIPRRQPWQLSRDLATLDHLSDGRVLLCGGLGQRTEYTPFGRPYDQRQLGQQYDEALDVVAGLWTGESFSYDGEYYTLEDAVLLPTPVQKPRIPVIIGGLWPNKKPFHRGARWDGIVPHFRGDGVILGNDVDPADEVRRMLEYYHTVTDDPGEILLPADPPGVSPDYVETCRELGATWLYVRPRDESGEWELTMDRVRDGPPE